MDLNLPEEIEKAIESALGPTLNFKGKKSILTTIVGSPTNTHFNELYYIRKTIDTPEFEEDKLIFNYLRSITEGTITTSKTIREEELEGKPQHIDFSHYKFFEESFYQGGKKVNISEVRTRPYLVLTDDMSKEELMSVKFYREHSVTFIMPKTAKLAKSLDENDHELTEFLTKNNVMLVDQSFENIGEASKYMTDHLGLSSVVSEAGFLTYQDYFTNPSLGFPCDCFVLTVYCGKLGQWATTKFPPMTSLLSKFKVIHQSQEVKTTNGSIYFLAMIPKNEMDTSLKKVDSTWFKIKKEKLH